MLLMGLFLVREQAVAQVPEARERRLQALQQQRAPLQELPAQARQRAGMCDCGALLSRRGERSQCRTCGREYRT